MFAIESGKVAKMITRISDYETFDFPHYTIWYYDEDHLVHTGTISQKATQYDINN